MELETKSLESKDAANHREIKDAFDDFLRAFDAFKDANDERIAQIEKRSADVVTEEKVDRINRALDEQKRALDELSLAAHRPSIGGEQKSVDRAGRERKVAFDRYMRKGDAAGFNALEVKALSEGLQRGWRLHRAAGNRADHRPNSGEGIADPRARHRAADWIFHISQTNHDGGSRVGLGCGNGFDLHHQHTHHLGHRFPGDGALRDARHHAAVARRQLRGYRTMARQ